MTTELYIGNLSRNTTEDEIRTMFEPAGEITEVTVMLDPETGNSKGFGFVNMKTFIAANEAITRFNGQMLDNNKLTVQKSGKILGLPLMGAAGGSLRNYRQGGRGRI
ncbi:MAG: RNA-binding protein [Anaerolineae bacterium]|nr:RNA-binding protein [Anaerolineae bacterium]